MQIAQDRSVADGDFVPLVAQSVFVRRYECQRVLEVDHVLHKIICTYLSIFAILGRVEEIVENFP